VDPLVDGARGRVEDGVLGNVVAISNVQMG